MINADHHYQIGRSHSECQDYAASQSGFAALADGCSCVLGADGKPFDAHTDIGARLLVRAAFHHQTESDANLMYRLAVNTADGYRRQLGLGVETLSATLLTIRDANPHFIYTGICGDGVMAWRRRGTKQWACLRKQYDGPPMYPRYCLMQKRPEIGKVTVTSPFTEIDYGCDSDLAGPMPIPKESADIVLAISDGAFSFTKGSTPVPFDTELANRFLDFRGLKGRFVLRHLSGVLRELEQDGIVNQDDISIIAMHVE